MREMAAAAKPKPKITLPKKASPAASAYFARHAMTSPRVMAGRPSVKKN